MPFCGSKDIKFEIVGREYILACQSCGGRMQDSGANLVEKMGKQYSDGIAKLINKWNTRVDDVKGKLLSI